MAYEGIVVSGKSGSESVCVCGNGRWLVENTAPIIGPQREKMRNEWAQDGFFCLRDVEPYGRIKIVCI
jgi:hypothetical protein